MHSGQLEPWQKIVTFMIFWGGYNWVCSFTLKLWNVDWKKFLDEPDDWARMKVGPGMADFLYSSTFIERWDTCNTHTPFLRIQECGVLGYTQPTASSEFTAVSQLFFVEDAHFQVEQHKDVGLLCHNALQCQGYSGRIPTTAHVTRTCWDRGVEMESHF